MKRFVLMGNPNAGKTTLFNRLVGGHHTVGNWPGVTTEWAQGTCTLHTPSGTCEEVAVVDLPGIYTLVPTSHDNPCDEQVTLKYLEEETFDLVVHVVNLGALERHVFLTLQALERGLPVVVALNNTAHWPVPPNVPERLSALLGCPVFWSRTLNTHEGQERLYRWLHVPPEHPSSPCPWGQELTERLEEGARVWPESTPNQRRALMEGDTRHGPSHPEGQAWQHQCTTQGTDLAIAQTRYAWLGTHLACFQGLLPQQHAPTTQQGWDRWFLHQWFGVPCFLGIMYLLFFWSIRVGSALQAPLVMLFEHLILWPTQHLMVGAPALLQAMVLGAFSGANTLLEFVPVLGCLFLGLGFLEASGYMVRAALVVDRTMRLIGLPGKSFVPLLIGFGCNVPAIMATRSLENQRDRILTVLMTPFMSCGARLAIFTLFAAHFFPVYGHHVIFVLYWIGLLMALFTGFVLDRWLLKGVASPLVLEVPDYQRPRWGALLRQAQRKVVQFLHNAAKTVLPVCVLISALQLWHWPASEHSTEAPKTVLRVAAEQITPLLSPMGLKEEHWPATVALLTGLVAKETVIATLDTLYDTNPEPHKHETEGATFFTDLWSSMRAGLWPEAREATADEHPMVLAFTPAVAFAYLVFVLLYVPCVSTVAVMIKEIGRSWAYFSVVWTTVLAYAAAVVAFQLSQINLQPLHSIAWCAGMMGLVVLPLWWMRAYLAKQRRLPTPIHVRMG